MYYTSCIFIICSCSDVLDNVKLWHDDEFATSRGEGEGVSQPAGLPLQFGKTNHAQVHLNNEYNEKDSLARPIMLRVNMFQGGNLIQNKLILVTCH